MVSTPGARSTTLLRLRAKLNEVVHDALVPCRRLSVSSDSKPLLLISPALTHFLSKPLAPEISTSKI